MHTTYSIPKIFRPFTNAVEVVIENTHFYYSYNTLMACKSPYLQIRIESPSITTTKHLMKMGVNDFTIVSEKMFNVLAGLIIQHPTKQNLLQRCRQRGRQTNQY